MDNICNLSTTTCSSAHSKFARRMGVACYSSSMSANQYIVVSLNAFMQVSNAKCLVFWCMDFFFFCYRCIWIF